MVYERTSTLVGRCMGGGVDGVDGVSERATEVEITFRAGRTVTDCYENNFGYVLKMAVGGNSSQRAVDRFGDSVSLGKFRYCRCVVCS